MCTGLFLLTALELLPTFKIKHVLKEWPGRGMQRDPPALPNAFHILRNSLAGSVLPLENGPVFILDFY